MALSVSTRRRPQAAEILRLYRFAHWAAHRNAASVRQMLRHTPLLATAWEGKKLVGMARCGTDFCYRAVIWDVIVDPKFTSQGLGSRLLNSLLKHPRLKSVESFWLATTDKHGFYSRFGFKRNKDNIMVLKRGKR